MDHYWNPPAVVADATDDRTADHSPSPPEAERANRHAAVNRSSDFCRGGSREERAAALFAGLAAIGWRVRRARAMARWRALAGGDRPDW